MKNIMKTGAGFIAILALLMLNTPLRAQDWSPAQKEVWKTVSDYWAVYAKGDVAGFMEYFHPDYSGWENDMKVPGTKEDARKWLTFAAQGSKTLVYDIQPLSIKVWGDFAFVHYYYTVVKETDGKKKGEEGRWTDILSKQGGKWLLIGDHGGSEKDD